MAENSPCPLCGQFGSTIFDQRTFRPNKTAVVEADSSAGIAISNRLCSNCGLVYQSPRMSDEELASFYEREYRMLYQGSPGPSKKDLTIQELRAQSLLEFTQTKVASIRRHLDVGCSAGLLLKTFAGHYHCESVGIEPGEAYRTAAQEAGLKVYPTLEEMAEPNMAEPNMAEPYMAQQFDLISMAHVLEHLPDPVKSLIELRERWLTKGGWLLIEVPNLYGHDCFEVAHLVSYSPHTLEQTLLKAGFTIHAKKIHGRPRSGIIPLYITMLARESESRSIQDTGEKLSIVKEDWVKRKRQVALLRRQALTRLQPKRAWRTIDDINR